MCEEDLSWARSHIDECFEKHAKCAKPVQTLLPTRLLHISRSTEEELEPDLEVRLQEIRGM
jgi:hypothetical protein